MICSMLLFLLTYIFILIFPKYKSYIALFMAFLFIILGFLPLNMVISSINFDVLMMIFGIMGIVLMFIDSKMPHLIADKIVEKMPHASLMIVAIAILTAIISAFVDNVATVLMIVPITLVVARKLAISPVPMVIAVSVFSNLEGAATLVGDTTSILLADDLHMNFMDFFVYNGKIGLFFIVQIAMIVSAIILYLQMKKYNKNIEIKRETKVRDYMPTITLLLVIVTLIVMSFISSWEYINGFVCMVYFIILLIYEIIKNKDIKLFTKYMKDIDYDTLIFLTALFIIIGGIEHMGGISAIANVFMKFDNNPILLYTIIVLVSVITSSFVDNIPYVMAMLPVINMLGGNLIYYYALIVGATLGGSFTPIGAATNITSIGILNKNGYHVSFIEYIKHSWLLVLSAVLTGYLLILLFVM